ncbi:MAG: haloacid dehalogenase type II [Pseudomonadota bacterium]
MAAITHCVFDAYGTLFDVGAAARDAAAEEAFEVIKDSWQPVAETWRDKQLAYTWLRATSGCHTDFWTVTKQALDWTLEYYELTAVEGLRDRLLALYWELAPFEEVQRTLTALKGMEQTLAILSNGEPEMLEAAVTSARLGGLFDAVLSAEQVGVFKPHARVYDLVEKTFGCPRQEVLFVSSNGWDACCAAAYGFRTLWVNRRQEPVDRLPVRPNFVADTLVGLPRVIESL